MLGQFTEICLIIHSWPDDLWSIPQFTIACTGGSESNQRIQEFIDESSSLIAEAGDSETDLVSLFGGDKLNEISVERTDELILFSNTIKKSRDLLARLDPTPSKKFKSLARNRSFMRVQKLLEKRAGSPQIRGYIAPKSFRRLITTLITGEQVIMIDAPESIASAGFQILLENSDNSIQTPSGTYQPIVSWDFVLTYTVPASGFGKLIESFRPFDEFPPLPFSVTSLNAFSFDMSARYDAGKAIFDKYQKHLFAPADEASGSPGMSFERYFGFKEFGISNFSDAPEKDQMLNASNGTITVYHEENPVHWQPAITIKKVTNRKFMNLLLESGVKSRNSSNSSPDKEQLVEIPNDHGRLFGLTETGIRSKLERQAKSWRDSGSNVPEYMSQVEDKPLSEDCLSRQYEYFINDDWMIHADHNSMKQFLNAVYEDPPEPGAFDLLLDATRELSGQDSFFKVSYQSNMYYYVKDRQTHSSVESSRIKAKYGDDSGRLSQKVWDKLMSKPNGIGLRNTIESTEDTVAAVKQLLIYALNDTFGTFVNLYSGDDQKMRIFGQVFSLAQDPDE